MAKKRYLKHHPKVERGGGTVALIGMGPSITSYLTETLTQEYQPNHCDEVWAINMSANVIRHDVVIWMDNLADQEDFKPGLFAALRSYGTPVLTTKATRSVVPNSYDFPIDEVTALSMPIFGKPYFNNGVAMAIAYAIWKGVKTLKMYGCDFTYPNRNYAEGGRGCTEAWMALASASGMQIVLPESTSLFDAVEVGKGVYGYAEQPIINMPDGSKYDPTTLKMTPPHEAVEKEVIMEETGEVVAEYKPEDSSPKKRKTKDAVQRRIPRANGSAAAVAGSAGIHG